jgi:hypothetical protein
VCRALDDETCTRHMSLCALTAGVFPSGGDKDEVGMMNRVVRVAVAAGVMALGAVLVPGAPAVAAAPEISHTRLDLSLIGIDQCGITVNSVVQGTLIQQTFVRSGTVVQRTIASVVSTLTNPANGKVVHVDSAGPDTFTPDGVANPDGTITFTDVLTGRDIRVYTSHNKVLLRDVGYLAIVTTTNANGDVLSEQVTTHGPHGFAGDFDAYCNAITAAIG